MATSKTTRRSTAARAVSTAGNGLTTFAMHRGDPVMATRFRALRAGRRGSPGFAGIAATAGEDLSRLDPETAAWHHLQQALGEQTIPELTAPKVGQAESEFKRLGSEYLPLTDSRTVKFRQAFNNIPVYGSLVTVELDDSNECLAISSALGEPRGVDPVARIAPTEIVAKAAKLAGRGAKALRTVPLLHYFFDAKAGKWRLVYILESVPVNAGGKAGPGRRAPYMKDFVFDAHSGTLVAELPRTASLAAVRDKAKDSAGAERNFECDQSGGKKVLRNLSLNVQTYDFGFRDPDIQDGSLPGKEVTNPPAPWLPAAVSAHANAEDVARFLREVLKRNNIDNRGGAMRSSVNCVVRAESPGGREWLNAYWVDRHRQMVYGQRKDHAVFHSMAENPDVVGHEMFHGVTDFTARLEYANQSGAMNESYSDIFGLIISNRSQPDIGKWNWEIGEGLDRGGKPFRDMRNPEKYDQPRHMRHYQRLPNTENGDWGGVHTNSGIHNYAAYRILSARSGHPARYLFAPSEVAALYYICLTQYLSRTSTFADSRRGVLLAARTLFRNDSPTLQQKKVRAIHAGFAAAGITG